MGTTISQDKKSTGAGSDKGGELGGEYVYTDRETETTSLTPSGVEINFLLLGISESGKTTMYKMLNSVFSYDSRGPPMIEETVQFLKHVKIYVLNGIATVLQAMKKNSIEFEKSENKAKAQLFLSLQSDSANTTLSAIAKCLIGLWEDKGVQKAFVAVDEKTPIWNLGYFVEKMPEIAGIVAPGKENDIDISESYIPSYQDLSRIEQPTTTVNTQKVNIKGQYKCTIVDVGGLRSERSTKWAQCFRDTTAVMYIVDSSAFDICLTEDPHKNRLLEALECFELLVSNRWLQGISFVLFLNKQDILLEKVCERKKLIQSQSRSHGFLGYSSFSLDEGEAKDIVKTAKFLDYPVKDLAKYFKTRAFIKYMFETVFASVRDLRDNENEDLAVYRARAPPSCFYRMNRPYQSNLRGECYSYYMVAVEPDSISKIFPDAVTCILQEFIHNANLF